MRRTTLRNNNCAAAANFLGIPLTNTVGNITLRGDETDCLQPDDVAVWLENSVIGKVGALDHSRWKLSISAEPINYDDNADPELVDMVVNVRDVESGVNQELVLLMDIAGTTPVLYDVQMEDNGWKPLQGPPPVTALRSTVQIILRCIHVLCHTGKWSNVNCVYIPQGVKPGVMRRWASWEGMGHASHFNVNLTKPPL